MIIADNVESMRPKLIRLPYEEYEFQARLRAGSVYFNDPSMKYNHLLMFEFGVHRIRFNLVGATPTSIEIDDTTAEYWDAFNDVDIKYTLEPNKVKEDIIIKSTNAPHSFEFVVNEYSVSSHFHEDGSFEYQNDAGETICVIEAPYAYDANGEEIDVITTYDGHRYTYELTSYENSAYPITLDPTITTHFFYSSMPGTGSVFSYYSTSPEEYQIFDKNGVLLKAYSPYQMSSALGAGYYMLLSRAFAVKKNILVGGLYYTMPSSYYTTYMVKWVLLRENGTYENIYALYNTFDMIPFYSDDTTIKFIAMSDGRLESNMFYWKPSIITLTIDKSGEITAIKKEARTWESSCSATVQPHYKRLTNITSKFIAALYQLGSYYYMDSCELSKGQWNTYSSMNVNYLYYGSPDVMGVNMYRKFGSGSTSDKLVWQDGTQVEVPKINNRRIGNIFLQFEDDNKVNLYGQELDSYEHAFGLHKFNVNVTLKSITYDSTVYTHTSLYSTTPALYFDDGSAVGYYMPTAAREIVTNRVINQTATIDVDMAFDLLRRASVKLNLSVDSVRVTTLDITVTHDTLRKKIADYQLPFDTAIKKSVEMFLVVDSLIKTYLDSTSSHGTFRKIANSVSVFAGTKREGGVNQSFDADTFRKTFEERVVESDSIRNSFRNATFDLDAFRCVISDVVVISHTIYSTFVYSLSAQDTLRQVSANFALFFFTDMLRRVTKDIESTLNTKRETLVLYSTLRDTSFKTYRAFESTIDAFRKVLSPQSGQNDTRKFLIQSQYSKIGTERRNLKITDGLVDTNRWVIKLNNMGKIEHIKTFVNNQDRFTIQVKNQMTHKVVRQDLVHLTAQLNTDIEEGLFINPRLTEKSTSSISSNKTTD